MGWYEAEAVPPNVLGGPARVGHGAACPKGTPIKEGDMCQSNGGEVGQILGRAMGSLTYNNITVPSDGTYDVTWYYHCGLNDNFGDKNCGGQTNPPTTMSGCRPHQIVVNGTEMPGTYHFPCYPGGWIIMHIAKTALPLKGGMMNSIKVYSKAPRDSADLDAISVLPPGMGTGPLLMSNMDPLGM
jgi:hypothetical protein